MYGQTLGRASGRAGTWAGEWVGRHLGRRVGGQALGQANGQAIHNALSMVLGEYVHSIQIIESRSFLHLVSLKTLSRCQKWSGNLSLLRDTKE